MKNKDDDKDSWKGYIAGVIIVVLIPLIIGIAGSMKGCSCSSPSHHSSDSDWEYRHTDRVY